VVYCVVPRDLAAALHEPLRRHFREDPSVEVVVERRTDTRRSGRDRRSAPPGSTGGPERRRIRSQAGRRVAERRSAAIPVRAPQLPRAARPFAERLVFVERLRPAGLHEEDAEANRLVTAVQAGDGRAMGELYLRYFDRVYGYLRVALRNAHEAEDATQQVFVNAMESLPRFEIRQETPFRGWLFRIARNHAVAQLRARGRLSIEDPKQVDRRRAEESYEPAAEVLGWLSDDELMMFIERLPALQQQVLVLKYLLGFTTDEIGVLVDRSPDSVRQLQHRALRFLRERLSAVGRRTGSESRQPMLVVFRQARVLRDRRFALGRPRRAA
jgi:RNA polymerase sigma-70 factor (ECF subfamily)